MAIVERLETSSKVRGLDLQGTSMPKMGKTVGRRVVSPRQPMMSRVETRDAAAITRGRRSTRKVASPHYGRNCSHKGKMIAFLEKHKGSKGDSFSSDKEACMKALQMVNAFMQKKKSKKRRGLVYAMVDIVRKTQEALVDTGAIHNLISPRVAEWLGLKPTKDGSWFTTVNAKEQPTKGVVKNVDLRISGWTRKANFNIIDMDELGVVLGMDFMEKSSAMLNPYCGMMMMADKVENDRIGSWKHSGAIEHDDEEEEMF
ncbi:LOW QUALITY PROTEIN: hypothetical protein RJ639_018985 [Escallonia herrerae]|uniref:Uncharacterized protein n=1 Tax=Escallonia herrerae TaxID=1293975 RepID=A0AA88VC03_9ASTE|nr:LOW QUALITY PROTEIN: hypothetical protein RJ639_018985 [Escallonia herrerae]